MLRALIALCFVGVLVAQLQQCPQDCAVHGTCMSNGDCYCDSGYEGDDCSIFNQNMKANTLYSNSVERQEWRYYSLTTNERDSITWTLTRTSSEGDCDLYLNRDDFPTRLFFINRNVSSQAEMTIFRENTEPGLYIAGVWGYRSCDYTIQATLAPPCHDMCNNRGKCVDGVCECQTGYTGEFCEVVVATPGHEYPGFVNDLFEWEYFAFIPTPGTIYDAIEWTLTPKDSHDHNCQAYLSTDHEPTLYSWDETDVTNSDDPLSLTVSEVTAGHVYYMSVNGMFGLRHCNFTVSVKLTTPVTPTECPNNCSYHANSCNNNVCDCRTGYNGTECEEYRPNIGLDHTETGYAGTGAWNYYNFEDNTSNNVLVTLTRTSTTGDVDLYVNIDQKPTRFDYTACDFSGGTHMEVSIPDPIGSMWYIGVFGWEGANYTLVLEEETTCQCVHGTCVGKSSVCSCDKGYAGDMCEYPVTPLTSGVPLMNQVVGLDQWNYYEVSGITNSSAGQVTVVEHSAVGVAWVFVDYDVFPTLTDYAYNDKNHHDSKHQISYHTKAEESGNLFIGVYGSPYITEVDGSPTVEYDIEAWVSGF